MKCVYMDLVLMVYVCNDFSILISWCFFKIDVVYKFFLIWKIFDVIKKRIKIIRFEFIINLM